NNTTSSGPAPDIDTDTSTPLNANYTLIKTPGTTTINGTGNITGVDPNLGALADNGSTILSGSPSVAQQHPQTELPNSGSPVINAIAAGTTFVSAIPSQGSCSGTSTVTCNLGAIANGGNATVTIQVKPTTAGTVTNTANVSDAPQNDPNASNNSSTTAITVAP